MLDAAQAKVVAYTTPDGEILCAEHAEEQYGEEIRAYVDQHGIEEEGGTRFDMWEAFDAAGLTAISRFDIGEMESQNLYGLEPADLAQWLDREGLTEDFIDEIIEASSDGAEAFSFQRIVEEAWDNSMLARERCDNNGEII